MGYGRNQGHEQRLELVTLLWVIYHGFEPTLELGQARASYSLCRAAEMAIVHARTHAFIGGLTGC